MRIPTKINNDIDNFLLATSLLKNKNNVDSEIDTLLNAVREKLCVDVVYIFEALSTGKGLTFTHMNCSDPAYSAVGQTVWMNEDDWNQATSVYDKDGLCDYHFGFVDEKSEIAILHYGIFHDEEYDGSVGMMDYKNSDRVWTEEERVAIRKLGYVLSSTVVGSRLKKINKELEQVSELQEEVSNLLSRERRMFRDALTHECEYAYLVNVNENKIHDIYCSDFLEKFLFNPNGPYNEIIDRVMERMQPVVLSGTPDFCSLDYYINAYEQGKRIDAVEYYVPAEDAYKRRTLFLSRDTHDVTFAFVVAYDITEARREELETKKSLIQLAAAAKQVGQGDLDVEFDTDIPGPVGLLAGVLSQTIDNLKWHIDKLNQQATIDALTHVKNKRAWQTAEEKLNEQIEQGHADFAVAVCDVNGLKQINDQCGHEAGDALIINASRHICKIFKHSPVFRIGGDEFTAILQGDDLAQCDTLVEQFHTIMAQNTYDPPVSIALGISRYAPGDDFAAVFQRADATMYENKKAMKKTKPR